MQRAFLVGNVATRLAPHNVLHWATFALRPSPFALRPSPFALRPSPFALRPSPFALRPSPFALRPSPFALRPSWYRQHFSTMAARPLMGLGPRTPSALGPFNSRYRCLPDAARARENFTVAPCKRQCTRRPRRCGKTRKQHKTRYQPFMAGESPEN
ncbi:hypothetical protein LMG33810_002121 [Carnimonas sp. LMG 33810]